MCASTPAARRFTIICTSATAGCSSSSTCCSACCGTSLGADHVTYVRNITDVDDKINARAAERGVDIRVLTDEMTKIFHEDAKALGCLPPTVEPRATEHIAQMLAMIEKLVAKGHAYTAEGHVLFDVRSMPDLRQAVEAFARRYDRGRAGRGRALQARADGFRLVETFERRRARLGQPLGARAARLAHRVLGDELNISRRNLRHSRRRHRSRVSASRERDRAEPLRPSAMM